MLLHFLSFYSCRKNCVIIFKKKNELKNEFINLVQTQTCEKLKAEAFFYLRYVKVYVNPFDTLRYVLNFFLYVD